MQPYRFAVAVGLLLLAGCAAPLRAPVDPFPKDAVLSEQFLARAWRERTHDAPTFKARLAVVARTGWLFKDANWFDLLVLRRTTPGAAVTLRGEREPVGEIFRIVQRDDVLLYAAQGVEGGRVAFVGPLNALESAPKAVRGLSPYAASALLDPGSLLADLLEERSAEAPLPHEGCFGKHWTFTGPLDAAPPLTARVRVRRSDGAVASVSLRNGAGREVARADYEEYVWIDLSLLPKRLTVETFGGRATAEIDVRSAEPGIALRDYNFPVDPPPGALMQPLAPLLQDLAR